MLIYITPAALDTSLPIRVILATKTNM